MRRGNHIATSPVLPLLIASLTACGGGGSAGPATNSAPAASAGPDQSVAGATTVHLTGTASDPDGSVASMLWTQTGGTPVTLAGANSDTPSFTSPTVAFPSSVTLQFALRVTDDGGMESTDTVTVTVMAQDFLVFRADMNVGTEELWLTRVAASPIAPVKLSGTMVSGGDVRSFAVSPDGRYVAYDADQDTDQAHELYVVATDGSGTPVKVSGAMIADGDIGTFAWAPDSSRLAYTADASVDGQNQLFSILPDGTGRATLNEPLVPGGSITQIGWAPDSTAVAYYGDQDTDGTSELFVANPDGLGSAVKINGSLVAGGSVSSDWSWAPNASRLAYRADQDTDGVRELYTNLPDGSGNAKINDTLVTGGDVRHDRSQWSPDSSALAYTADQDTDGVRELFVAAPDGSGTAVKVNHVLVSGGDVSDFAWAPDGSRLCYRGDCDTVATLELFTALPNGTGHAKINDNLITDGDVLNFEWAPDASRILYRADQGIDEVYELYTATANGGGRVKVSGPLISGGDVSSTNTRDLWATDATKLIYDADQDADTIYELYAVPAGLSGGDVKLSGTLGATQDVGVDSGWVPSRPYVVFRVAGTTTPTYMRAADGSGSPVQLSPTGLLGSVEPDWVWHR